MGLFVFVNLVMSWILMGFLVGVSANWSFLVHVCHSCLYLCMIFHTLVSFILFVTIVSR